MILFLQIQEMLIPLKKKLTFAPRFWISSIKMVFTFNT